MYCKHACVHLFARQHDCFASFCHRLERHYYCCHSPLIDGLRYIDAAMRPPATAYARWYYRDRDKKGMVSTTHVRSRGHNRHRLQPEVIQFTCVRGMSRKCKQWKGFPIHLASPRLFLIPDLPSGVTGSVQEYIYMRAHVFAYMQVCHTAPSITFYSTASTRACVDAWSSFRHHIRKHCMPVRMAYYVGPTEMHTCTCA